MKTNVKHWKNSNGLIICLSSPSLPFSHLLFPRLVSFPSSSAHLSRDCSEIRCCSELRCLTARSQFCTSPCPRAQQEVAEKVPTCLTCSLSRRQKRVCRHVRTSRCLYTIDTDRSKNLRACKSRGPARQWLCFSPPSSRYE